MKKSKLTLNLLKKEAKNFSINMSKLRHEELVGVTDGKAVGTFIEHKFKNIIQTKYNVKIGSSASGIDFPSSAINTDIKTTSITQPQSSCPFKNARQKIFSLGYNILLFVYEKDDKKPLNLSFLYCVFIDKIRTADYQTTRILRERIEHDANLDDIKGFLLDINLPADEIELEKIANEILQAKPNQGYLTISNALQWRLQYTRVIKLENGVPGVTKLYAQK